MLRVEVDNMIAAAAAGPPLGDQCKEPGNQFRGLSCYSSFLLAENSMIPSEVLTLPFIVSWVIMFVE